MRLRPVANILAFATRSAPRRSTTETESISLIGRSLHSSRSNNNIMSTWFQDLFGFDETVLSYDEVRSRFDVRTDGDGSITLLTTAASDDVGVGQQKSFHVGKFDTPSVTDLRKMLSDLTVATAASHGEEAENLLVGGGLTFDHMVGDAAEMHQDAALARSVFQAASQFNCLEMIEPSITPDEGVTCYGDDYTQGPACATSCAAGAVYRNYFVGGYGQGGERGRQLDLLKDVGAALDNEEHGYWTMTNGYALPTDTDSIASLRSSLQGCDEASIDAISDRLKVGVHWDTEVTTSTASTSGHRVAQVYASALPCAYSRKTNLEDWEPFARMVLDGAYEATLLVAAILARQRRERVSVFLTKIGGGVFGNDAKWISDAINGALDMCSMEPIDVYLVHFRREERCYVKRIGVTKK